MKKTLADVKLSKILITYDGKDRMVSSKDYEMPENGIQSFKTRIMPTFDFKSQGMQAGELVIIGGASGEGKTLLLLSMIDGMDAQGLNVAFFSFEQTQDQIQQKYNYDPPNYYYPNDIDFMLSYDPEIERMRRDQNSYLYSLGNRRMQWLYLKLTELRAKGHSPQIVFIDYLHSITGFGSNMIEAIGQAMDSLKELGRMFNCVFVVIAHTVKSATEKGSKRDDNRGNKIPEPGMSDLRDSGWVINTADIIFLLWRETDEYGGNTNKTTVKICKHRRNGDLKNFKIKMVFNGSLLNEASREDGYFEHSGIE